MAVIDRAGAPTAIRMVYCNGRHVAAVRLVSGRWVCSGCRAYVRVVT